MTFRANDYFGCVMNVIARYSYRNATIGSTFVARLAGT